MIKLRVIAGPGVGADFELTAARVTIGRDLDNQIRFPDSLVSRHHAELTRDGARYRLRDLQSSNGSFVNGERVEQAALQPGDKLRLADVELEVIEESAPNRPLLAKPPLPPPREKTAPAFKIAPPPERGVWRPPRPADKPLTPRPGPAPAAPPEPKPMSETPAQPPSPPPAGDEPKPAPAAQPLPFVGGPPRTAASAPQSAPAPAPAPVVKPEPAVAAPMPRPIRQVTAPPPAPVAEPVVAEEPGWAWPRVWFAALGVIGILLLIAGYTVPSNLFRFFGLLTLITGILCVAHDWSPLPPRPKPQV